MKNGILFIAGLLVSVLPAAAGTLDDIRVLEAGKGPGIAAPALQSPVAGMRTVPLAASPATAPIWHRLSDGREVNLRDWTLVMFMSSSCEYSHKFGPVIKQFTARSGLPVFPFSMDGRGDATFPDVLPATPDVVVEYFQSGIPISTPTTFLTHVNTMETWPLLQEAAELPQLVARLDEVFRLALDRQSGKSLPTPTGGTH